MLDLKYRPRRFADIIGNSAVVQLLLSCSRKGTLASRSMMFGGPKGCGKTSLARIAARAIVCDDLRDGEPCNECNSCLAVISESAESFDEFDAATQGTVDRMRTIVSELEYGSLDSKPFVFILDEAHRLTKQAQDALLKSVEDRRLIVIMCTTEPHKLQGAIRSRVTEYPVVPPSMDQLVPYLGRVCSQEKIGFEPEALTLLAKGQDCCPRTCLTTIELLSTATAHLDLQSVKSHLRFASSEALVSALAILDSNPAQALAVIDQLFSNEGPVWVRDNIVSAISSSMRVSVGAKPTYPVPTSFFQNRGAGWADLARQLGTIDKPHAADIEAALLSGLQVIRSSPVVAPVYVAPPPAPMTPPTPTQAPAPVVATSPAPPPKDQPPAPPVAKVEAPKEIPRIVPAEIEVDGVVFSKIESLTSLDAKIERTTRGAPVPLTAVNGPAVELDKTRIPLSEKEFARGFSERYKKSERS